MLCLPTHHSFIHTQPVCLAPQSIHCPANSHRSHKPLSPAFPSTQPLPLDPHSLLHKLSIHYCLFCSPSTQPVSYPLPMQEGNHPPSLQPRISVPGCFNTRSRFPSLTVHKTPASYHSTQSVPGSPTKPPVMPEASSSGSQQPEP